MRKWIDLVEAVVHRDRFIQEATDLDFDDDFDDELPDETPTSKYPFLSDSQKKYLDKNKRSKNRVQSREKNQRDFEKHVEREDDNDVKIFGGATHKAVAGYKPLKTPLIRFGKFRKSSNAFVDQEETEETPFDQIGTTRRNERGVSCYEAYDNKDGTFTLLEPSMASTWNSSNNPFVIAEGKYKELYEYLVNGTPMDIFLIYGHWIGEGKNGEYLASGSDGEPLLDISKPYKMERIAPEKIIIGRATYVQCMLDRYKGLDGVKKKLDYDPEF